jgi:hypothetical protein
MSEIEKPALPTPEDKARQKRRSRAIGLAVVGLVVLFYLITIFKMGPAIMNRSL